jgi:nitric oxide reductase large subunit
LGLLSLIDGAFSERLRPLNRNYSMSPQPASTSPRAVAWPSVVTVISAAILIGAEVFGAAFAGGWALAILFGLDDTAAHILQAVLFGIGVLIMVAFIRAAQRIEPFFRRA